MQLKRLYIKEYKILKDFTYEFPFDSKRYNNVIIGINGSGKSTILEAIAEIFSCVFLSKESKFDFEIEYSIKSDNILSNFSLTNPNLKYIPIKITGDSGYLPRTEISFDLIQSELLDHADTHIKLSFAQRDFRNLIPNNIVIYYSGLSEIMEELCKPHEEKLSKAYRKGDTDIDRDFFYYKPEHFGIILLSLLSYKYGDVPNFLVEKAKIAGMQSIQIRLRKPHWANDTIRNFWGAKGKVKYFLDFLFSKMDNPKFIDSLITKDFSSYGNVVFEGVNDSYIIITIIGQEKLFEIREHLVEEKAIFKILYTMYLDDMLDDIKFSLYKDENGKRESFSILSEGEQQAITIKGLSELLAQENTLFLFDEPDTYLHPKWQRQLITEIEESIEQNIRNEITYLIATHSPQILSNAKPDKTYVKIIEDGQLIEITPKHYGREISSILYNLMGVEERNETIRNDLSKLFTLIEDGEIKEAETELQRLTKILGETDPDIKNAAIQLEYLKKDEADK